MTLCLASTAASLDPPPSRTSQLPLVVLYGGWLKLRRGTDRRGLKTIERGSHTRLISAKVFPGPIRRPIDAQDSTHNRRDYFHSAVHVYRWRSPRKIVDPQIPHSTWGSDDDGDEGGGAMSSTSEVDSYGFSSRAGVI